MRSAAALAGALTPDRVSRSDISGTDKATLGQTVERLEAEGTHHWTLQIAGLEEAFIYLMAGARDNFAGDPGSVAA